MVTMEMNYYKIFTNSLTEIYISESWEYSNDAFEQFFESCKKRTNCFGTIYYNESYIIEDHGVIFDKYVKEGVILDLDIW